MSSSRQNNNNYSSNNNNNYSNGNGRRSTRSVIPDDDYYYSAQEQQQQQQVQEEAFRQDFLQRQRNNGRGVPVPAPLPVEYDNGGWPTYTTRTTTTRPSAPPMVIEKSPSDEEEGDVQFEVAYNSSTTTTTTANNNHNYNHYEHYEDPDELYARQLQEEIEREDRILQAARDSSSRFTSTSNNTSSNRQYEITPVWNASSPVNVPAHAHRSEDDARLAQQLQDEELARSIAAGMANARKTNKSKPGKSARLGRPSASSRADPRNATRPRSSATTATTSFAPYVVDNNNNNKNSTVVVGHRVPFTNSTDSNSSDEPPENYYRNTRNTIDTDIDNDIDGYDERIAQEMQDAEMAQRLALFEEEAQNRRQADASTTIRASRSRLLVSRVLPLLCVGVAVAVTLLFVLGVFDPSEVPLVGDVFNTNNGKNDDYVDPFAGSGGIFGGGGGGGADGTVPIVNRQEQMGWANNDGESGVSLQILNALEDKWQTYFETAVANWDAGYPIDSLTLDVVRVNYEYECTSVTGKIKVCNGDYGDTKWRGINEVLVNDRTNVIVSSSAKMNEFYLLNEGDDQKLYTMCHEIGHGFGLPHWDEDFFNADLGNCMDYTNNPGDNDKPDATNFEFLAQIYGGRNVSSGEMVTAQALVQQESNNNQTQQGSGRRRSLGSGEQDTTTKMDNGVWQGLFRWVNMASRGGRSSPSSQPLLVSRVRLTTDETLPSQRRIILQANRHFEVHRLERRLEASGEEDLITLQFYLLADHDER